MSSPASRAEVAFTNRHLVRVLAYEAILVVVLVPWLVRRGWSPRRVVSAPQPTDLFRGIALWVATYVFTSFVWGIYLSLQPGISSFSEVGRQFTGVPAAPAVSILVSIFNPIFEEFLWLGYGINRMAPKIGVLRAAAMSIVLRTLVHLYQGPMALAGIVPIAVAFTWYYARTRRLWPVVVAHVLFDAIGLAARMS